MGKKKYIEDELSSVDSADLIVPKMREKTSVKQFKYVKSKLPIETLSSESESDEITFLQTKRKREEESDSDLKEKNEAEPKKIRKRKINSESSEESDESERVAKEEVLFVPTVYQPKEIFIKGLDYESTEGSVSLCFANFGTISKVKLIYDQSERFTGMAKVSFFETSAVDKVLSHPSKINLDGRTLRISAVKEDKKKKTDFVNQKYDGKKYVVYCGNINFKTTRNALAHFFRECNPIEVDIATDSKGMRKGHAHVVFKTEEDAIKAAAKNEKQLDGRVIKVDLCDWKKKEAKIAEAGKKKNDNEGKGEKLKEKKKVVLKSEKATKDGTTAINANKTEKRKEKSSKRNKFDLKKEVLEEKPKYVEPKKNDLADERIELKNKSVILAEDSD